MSVQSLTTLQKIALGRHCWRVFTDDQVTQNAIADKLAEETEGSSTKANIFYNGKSIPVFIVDFQIILFLAKNRANAPYSFTPYHMEQGSNVWRVWTENKKTPAQKLVKEDSNTSERLRGDALKDKKRARLLARSAR